MIEIFPNLYVGTGDDEAEVRGNPNWFIISAARDPWHRQLLGYTTRGAPKDDPEYLMAHRPGRLFLNLVDSADPKYVQDSIIETALEAIFENIGERRVLIHCNQGQSRSPTIALLYLARHDPRFAGLDYDDASAKFKTIYPPLTPSKGMADYAREHWVKTTEPVGG